MKFLPLVEIFEPVYNTMLHQKSSDTHTHIHTLRVQTLFSHSDNSLKQTKTQTTQQGSHRQKFPRSEVIRCYSNQKSLHETIQPWLTLLNFKYMLVCICIFKISGLIFSSTLCGKLGPKFSEGKQKFCKCSEIYSSGPKRFGARIEIFEPVYNTMLHQKSSDTHTHTHCECKHFSLTQISLQNRQKLKLLNKDLIVRSLPGQK